VVDVRTIPRSRHNPQYDSKTLEAGLKKTGIGYARIPGLGGLRRPNKDSINTGWENASFRGFADYMQTGDFQKALLDLVDRASKKSTAILCAEAVPWRCHRSLISDALLVRGIRVLHIMSKTGVREHSLTPWADTDGERITYPAPESQAAGAGRVHARKTTRKQHRKTVPKKGQ
jgi:uncharacterized protein (DUF488 family)